MENYCPKCGFPKDPQNRISLFHAKVQKLRRVSIPKRVCQALMIDEGNDVEVTVKKMPGEQS